MDDKTIKAIITAIDTVLSKGDRIEIIPVKNGVKIMRVRRDEIKP